MPHALSWARTARWAECPCDALGHPWGLAHLSIYNFAQLLSVFQKNLALPPSNRCLRFVQDTTNSWIPHPNLNPSSTSLSPSFSLSMLPVATGCPSPPSALPQPRAPSSAPNLSALPTQLYASAAGCQCRRPPAPPMPLPHHVVVEETVRHSNFNVPTFRLRCFNISCFHPQCFVCMISNI